MEPRFPENLQIAGRLREASEILQAQGANVYRVGAYRHAADTIEAFGGSLRELFERHGAGGLQRLPGVGVGIANAIAEMLINGHWSQLARLRGEADESTHAATPPEELPPVALLLDVDREYRAKAAAGRLPLIAPRRFNPQGKAWLPVLHATHGDWHFTALFSNTVRAHELGRVRDWVLIFFYDSDHHEQQCTVVTEHRGALTGMRVVRGREAECRRYLLEEQPA
jgi:DNA polymerase (family X)